MRAYSVDVQTDDEFADRVSAERLARIVETVLDQEAQPKHAEVTLVITGNERVRELNRVFRDVDEPTDVLSFPCGEGPQFVTPEELSPYLGDVIVSYPIALEQAQEQGHPVEKELALLIVHGCLHLLGYDHATEEDQQRMWARQDEILQLLMTP